MWQEIFFCLLEQTDMFCRESAVNYWKIVWTHNSSELMANEWGVVIIAVAIVRLKRCFSCMNECPSSALSFQTIVAAMTTLTPPCQLASPANQCRIDYVLNQVNQKDFEFPSVSRTLTFLLCWLFDLFPSLNCKTQLILKTCGNVIWRYVDALYGHVIVTIYYQRQFVELTNKSTAGMVLLSVHSC